MRHFSDFGEVISKGSGIGQLMDDLGKALAEGGGEMLMLGGGNPAHIPEIEAVWQERMREITESPESLRRVLSIYDPPRGNSSFLKALAGLLNETYGWNVGEENLAVTAGGQFAFFTLFNLLAGPSPLGNRKIVLPVAPEYIGYANQGIAPGIFRSVIPKIAITRPHSFKYHIDFDALSLGEGDAAVCISRPTNPSGNVLDDAEIKRLSDLTEKAGIPLIVDNAYGLPFPGILFKKISFVRKDHHIMVFSLSKLGLPGTRTAIVVASPEIARAVSEFTAVSGLANGNFGQAILRPLLENRRILSLVEQGIQPHYLKKRDFAKEIVDKFFPKNGSYFLHETEGAMFFWLWLPNSKKNSMQMYSDLKGEGVLVVPGEPFFFGLQEKDRNWPHQHQCLRISFAMAPEVVENGLKIISKKIS